MTGMSSVLLKKWFTCFSTYFQEFIPYQVAKQRACQLVNNQVSNALPEYHAATRQVSFEVAKIQTSTISLKLVNQKSNFSFLKKMFKTNFLVILVSGRHNPLKNLNGLLRSPDDNQEHQLHTH